MVTIAPGDNPGAIVKAEHHLAKKCERSANAQGSDPIFLTDFHVLLLISVVKTILQPYCNQSQIRPKKARGWRSPSRSLASQGHGSSVSASGSLERFVGGPESS
jgi:hypothetical protein